MGKTPQHKPYEEMKDTPWITQGRQIAQAGGEGILGNYNNVNVFSPETNASIDARNNEIYRRAFDNMNREYNRSMNKYNASNYNRFGTLNATAPYYITDQYQRDFQRGMNDLAYNQAMNYDTLRDKELQRRYNTLDMFANMYQYGNTPYQQDLKNWNIRNTNKDLEYNDAIAQYKNRNKLGSAIGGTLGAVGGALIPGGGLVTAGLGQQLGSAIGGIM